MAGVNDNLIPAKKGEVRNPKGKPKGTKNFKTIIEEFLDVETDAMNPMSGKLEKLSVGQQVVIALLAKAKKGDVSAIKELLDRIDGKAEQKLIHEGGFFNETELIIKKDADINHDNEQTGPST